MKKVKYLIIGGGIAGTTAAETIRREDKKGTIAIVSDEPYRLYSRIMLSKPNFFLEKIPFDKVWLKEEKWYADNGIGLIAGKGAVKLEPKEKKVSLEDGEVLKYEKLLLAIGGCTRRLTAPGADKKGVNYLRTLDDAKAVIADTKSAREAVVVGGGFVGFEMCEMLRLAGKEVTLLLREPYYWQILLDETSGKMIEEVLEKGGVKILRNTELAEITGKDSVEGITLKSGEKLPCQMVIIGIGIFCPFAWLQTAGIEVNRGIIANERLETNIPGIWTAGDCAEFDDLILGERIQMGNWVNAQVQGKTAGLNMAGKKEPFRLVSFYSTQGFGMTIAFVGDVRPEKDREIVTRGCLESNSYARLILKDDEIVGATLINRTQELGVLIKLIGKGITLSGRKKELSDQSFDLAELLK